MLKIRLFSFLVILSLLLLPVGASAAPDPGPRAGTISPSTSEKILAAPPWCGTPEQDGVGSLPDGTGPTDPPGSFPHIPYYAIGCTLADMQSRSNGRMEMRVIGQSALGRDMYLVTINPTAGRAAAIERAWANRDGAAAAICHTDGRPVRECRLPQSQRRPGFSRGTHPGARISSP